MKQGLFLFVLLLGTWLLLSGHYEATLMMYGVLCSAAVVGISARLRILDEETLPVALVFRTLLYLPWLFGQIVKSNWAVARVILDPALPIRPRLLRVSAAQQSIVAQVLYANSITLTPGTITLDVRSGQLLVHALTDASSAALLGGEMNRRVARLEGQAFLRAPEAQS